MKFRLSDTNKESVSEESTSNSEDLVGAIESSKSYFRESKNKPGLKNECSTDKRISTYCNHFTLSEKALKGFELMKKHGDLLAESYDSKKNPDIREQPPKKCTPNIPVDVNKPRFTSYIERIRQTPKADIRWSGNRGESLCFPSSDEAKKILEANGLKGIEYQNGVPDFSPLSEITVQLGNMTHKRFSHGIDGRDGKNTIYVHYNLNGDVESRVHHVDANSVSGINLKYNSPGNFNQADAITAKIWTESCRDSREWSAKDISEYRKQHGLTWHECNNGCTMMMIPKAINDNFGHLGGVGEVKEKARLISEALGDNDDSWLDSKDIEQMEEKEFATFERYTLEKNKTLLYSYGN